MRKTLLIITALMLIVGCSSPEPINAEKLIEEDGLMYHPDTKELYSGNVFKKYLGGKSQLEGSYKDGKRDGLWTEKFSDKPITGKVYGYFGEGKHYKKVYIGYIDNGKREGKWIIWYDNGKKKSETTYKDGKGDGLSTDWYENGQKSYEFTFKDGQPDGLWTGWYENGQKKYEHTLKDGKGGGLYTDWYENGQKENEGIFKDGKLVEFIGEWNEDGSVRE